MLTALIASVAVIGAAAMLAARSEPNPGWIDGAIRLPGAPRDVAVAGNLAWVSIGDRDTDAVLARVDLTTGDVTLVPETTGAHSIAVDATGVWVSVCARSTPAGCDGRAIAEVDPHTGSVRARREVEGINLELAVDRGLVWASMSGPNQLEAFDVDGLRSVETVPGVGSPFAVGQDAAWGFWQMRRVPELRKWPPGGGLSQPPTDPPAEPRRVRVPDACAFAVGPVDAWVVSCPRVEIPEMGTQTAGPTPSGTASPRIPQSELIVQAFDGQLRVVTSIPTSGSDAPAVAAVGEGAVVAWIDPLRQTLELRSVDLPEASDLPRSVSVPGIATGMYGAAPPLLATDASTSLVYVAIGSDGGGLLFPADVDAGV